MFGIFYKIHENLILPQTVTSNFISDIQNKTIFDGSPDEPYYKTLYRNIFFLASNIYLRCVLDKKSLENDKKFIAQIISTNNICDIERKLSCNRSFSKYHEILLSHHMIKEVDTKTSNAFDLDESNSCASSLTSYTAGNCWFNAKLSHGIELSEREKKIISDINYTILLVKPLSYPVTLFHGFEKYVKYDFANNLLNMKGCVSKTLSLNVAKRFACTVNYFKPEFLLVEYPVGSKHLHQSIRPFDEEFEYLSRTNETFKVVRTCKYFNGLQLLTFYVCVPL